MARCTHARGNERDAAGRARARDVGLRQRRQRLVQRLGQRGCRTLQRLERAPLAPYAAAASSGSSPLQGHRSVSADILSGTDSAKGLCTRDST